MKKSNFSLIVTTGLAIFTMLFGAGNLMFPLKVGIESGTKLPFGITGFVLTAVLMPILGLVSSLLFHGDYQAFFNRLGKIPGSLLIFCCMFAIGPMLIMPRIVAFSYEIAKPHLPANISLLFFSIIFVTGIFIFTYRPSKLITLLGSIIGPFKLGLLAIIIIKGLFSGGQLVQVDTTILQVFLKSLVYGYNTLDLLGTIFFGSVIYSILQSNLAADPTAPTRNILHTAISGALIGASILGIVYVAMSFLGAFHGTDLAACNEGEIFSTVCFRIIGSGGALLTAVAVVLACFSTMIALSAVLSEYISQNLSGNTLTYVQSLLITLGLTLIPANLGLSTILHASMPFIKIIYPVLIALTLCNTAYKLFGFKPVRIPVLITFVGTILATILL